MPEDNKGGRKQVSDDEILAVIQQALDRTDAPAVPTSDIAQLLPISRQAVKRRLESLSEDREIGMYKAGRNRIWWLGDETGAKGQFDLDDVIEPGDISDERLITLFREQLDVDELPDDLTEEIIRTRLPPEQIPDETLFEALRQNVEYTALPEDITDGIASNVYNYDTTYWGGQIRKAKSSFAFALLLAILAVFVDGVSPTGGPLGYISKAKVGEAFEFIAGVLIILATVLFFVGMFVMILGFISRSFRTNDASRPLRESFLDLLKKWA